MEPIQNPVTRLDALAQTVEETFEKLKSSLETIGNGEVNQDLLVQFVLFMKPVREAMLEYASLWAQLFESWGKYDSGQQQTMFEINERINPLVPQLKELTQKAKTVISRWNPSDTQ